MKKALLLASFLSAIFLVKANNIQVSNVTLTGQNVAQQFTLVQFDLSWENSWRLSVGPSNWDAAWVFVKYRRNGGDWLHANLNYVNGTPGGDGHTAPAGSTIRTTSDGVGCFIHRNADGNGDINLENIRLRWNYGSSINDEDILDVQVYAIEMVYISQGAFELGATYEGGEQGNFYTNTGLFGFQSTYDVTSENAITVSSGVGDLYYDNVPGANSGDQLGPIPAAFPKGFQAFYIMKYEVTEDQWICFFNSLTESQKLNHDITDSNHKNSDNVVSRNTIAYTSGNATTSAPSRALGFINWEDIAAYLDWSGLRPLTEMEYEKACRGPVAAKPNELAWGGTSAYGEAYTIVNDGTDAALVTDPGVGIGNICYSNTDPGGPMRVGIFAASAINKNREETGATYYGVMEMSGNLYERCISAGNPENRAFTGNHGNGSLSNSGYANVSTWPPIGNGASAYRGGSWSNGISFCVMADRYDAANSNDITNSRIGFRGVRTAE